MVNQINRDHVNCRTAKSITGKVIHVSEVMLKWVNYRDCFFFSFTRLIPKFGGSKIFAAVQIISVNKAPPSYQDFVVEESFFFYLILVTNFFCNLISNYGWPTKLKLGFTVANKPIYDFKQWKFVLKKGWILAQKSSRVPLHKNVSYFFIINLTTDNHKVIHWLLWNLFPVS